MKKMLPFISFSYLLIFSLLILFLAACHSESDKRQLYSPAPVAPPPASPLPPVIPTWENSVQLGSSSDDFAQDLARDSEGSFYITGRTVGNLEGNPNAGSNNTSDLFVTKISNMGVKLWTQQLGSSNNDAALGIVTDSANNVYVVGSTQGDLDENTNKGNNDNSSDIFIVKYSSEGTKQWSKQWGSANSEFASSVAVDSQNNLLLTGNTLGDLSGVNAGESDLFVAQYASDGTQTWVKQFGTANFETGYDIQTDSLDNIYIVGSTTGSFDNNTYANTGGNDNSSDLFLMKLSSVGTKLWTQQLGTSLHDVALALSIDSANNLYVTGYTSGGLDGNVAISNSDNSSDVFIVKYSSDGLKQWSKQLGSTSFDVAYSIANDSQNNVYLTGSTRGSFTGKSNANTTDNSSDLFVAKYSSAGVQEWIQQFGSAGEDRAVSLVVNGDNITITGFTSGGLDGSENSGGCDLFLIRYNAAGERQSKNTTLSSKTGSCSNVGNAVQSSLVSSSSHNVGQACLSCHSEGKAAYPPFTVAGSVYHSNQVTPNHAGNVMMTLGTAMFPLDSSGNFYSRDNVSFSTVKLQGINNKSFTNTQHSSRGGECNSCHSTYGSRWKLSIN